MMQVEHSLVVETGVSRQNCSVQCSSLHPPALDFLDHSVQHSVEIDFDRCLTDSS